jgi:hypothetical protein
MTTNSYHVTPHKVKCFRNVIQNICADYELVSYVEKVIFTHKFVQNRIVFYNGLGSIRFALLS